MKNKDLTLKELYLIIQNFNHSFLNIDFIDEFIFIKNQMIKVTLSEVHKYSCYINTDILVIKNSKYTLTLSKVDESITVRYKHQL